MTHHSWGPGSLQRRVFPPTFQMRNEGLWEAGCEHLQLGPAPLGLKSDAFASYAPVPCWFCTKGQRRARPGGGRREPEPAGWPGQRTFPAVTALIPPPVTGCLFQAHPWPWGSHLPWFPSSLCLCPPSCLGRGICGSRFPRPLCLLCRTPLLLTKTGDRGGEVRDSRTGLDLRGKSRVSVSCVVE